MAQLISSVLLPSSPDEAVFGHGQSQCVLVLLAEMREGNPPNLPTSLENHVWPECRSALRAGLTYAFKSLSAVKQVNANILSSL